MLLGNTCLCLVKCDSKIPKCPFNFNILWPSDFPPHGQLMLKWETQSTWFKLRSTSVIICARCLVSYTSPDPDLPPAWSSLSSGSRAPLGAVFKCAHQTMFPKFVYVYIYIYTINSNIDAPLSPSGLHFMGQNMFTQWCDAVQCLCVGSLSLLFINQGLLYTYMIYVYCICICIHIYIYRPMYRV